MTAICFHNYANELNKATSDDLKHRSETIADAKKILSKADAGYYESFLSAPTHSDFINAPDDLTREEFDYNNREFKAGLGLPF